MINKLVKVNLSKVLFVLCFKIMICCIKSKNYVVTGGAVVASLILALNVQVRTFLNAFTFQGATVAVW